MVGMAGAPIALAAVLVLGFTLASAVALWFYVKSKPQTQPAFTSRSPVPSAFAPAFISLPPATLALPPALAAMSPSAFTAPPMLAPAPAIPSLSPSETPRRSPDGTMPMRAMPMSAAVPATVGAGEQRSRVAPTLMSAKAPSLPAPEAARTSSSAPPPSGPVSRHPKAPLPPRVSYASIAVAPPYKETAPFPAVARPSSSSSLPPPLPRTSSSSSLPPTMARPSSSLPPTMARPSSSLPPPRRLPRTLPPPRARAVTGPLALSGLKPEAAADLLAAELKSDPPHAPDTEPSMVEDDSPTELMRLFDFGRPRNPGNGGSA
jgi:hypothetical protein